MLCISTFLAIRDAIAACGRDARDPADLRAPATPEAVLARDRPRCRAGAGTADERGTISCDDAYLFDSLSLLGRWLHLITGIAWIGASFYFVWLDDHLLAPTRKELLDAGVGGEVWAVHGGGFYNAQKYKIAPADVAGDRCTGSTGKPTRPGCRAFSCCACCISAKAEVYLIDPSVAALSKPAAIAIALAFPRRRLADLRRAVPFARSVATIARSAASSRCSCCPLRHGDCARCSADAAPTSCSAPCSARSWSRMFSS